MKNYVSYREIKKMVRKHKKYLSVPLSVSEIEIAIKQLKRGSATGIDEIFTELLFYGSEATVNWMKKLFDQI